MEGWMMEGTEMQPYDDPSSVKVHRVGDADYPKVDPFREVERHFMAEEETAVEVTPETYKGPRLPVTPQQHYTNGLTAARDEARKMAIAASLMVEWLQSIPAESEKLDFFLEVAEKAEDALNRIEARLERR